MVINYMKCTGCLSCVEACIAENINRVGPGGENIYPEDVVSYARTRPYVIKYKNLIRRVFKQCVQCESPPCVYSCPTGASYKNKDGIVLVDEKICIKCKLCIEACPYGARTFLEEPFPGYLKHEYALRDRVPDKCTFCIHRRSGEGLWVPACVEACPHEARLFGDLDNPDDEATKLVLGGIALPPREDLGTYPKVFIVPRIGGVELAGYPTRKEDQLISFPFWSIIKNNFVKPLVEYGATLAVLLGIIHLWRGRRHEKK